MNIVFMGTPDFSTQPLQALYDAGHHIKMVVTMPDKPKGRGYELVAPPVKELANKLGIPVFQPKSMKTEDTYQILKDIDADFYVVVAYGKILPKAILDLPRKACINIHASLLPSYRGAAPIQQAIIDGRDTTGITTMLMDEGLDTGDILKQYPIDIAADETGGGLFDKLAVLGAEAIVDTIENFDTIVPVKQGPTDTEYAKIFGKKDGDIDFTKSAIEIERLIRGLNPWPSAFSSLRGKTFKIWSAKVSSEDSRREIGSIYVEKGQLYVVTGKGVLELSEVQLEGKKRMSASDFIKGFQLKDDDRLIRR